MVYQDPLLVQEWDQFSADIVGQVRTQLRGRLYDFQLDRAHGQIVLRGAASSYHVKQLAQQAVMVLTPMPIHSNRIEVNPC